ncbi:MULTISPECIES: hypothetical protein [Bacillaceae]|uniref:DUF2524 family protein n=1 Tax=Metabacillus sediminis TaxID=3117746 RepID=A0ABZ2NL46_9BACI|nr:hypothetical protein [Bacillus sp. SJS]KZZ83048.1 hypothetical protein AS29_019875 [Bacillus sp. SJS]
MKKKDQELSRLQLEVEKAEVSATEATRILNAMFDSDYPDSHLTSTDSIEHLKEQMDANIIHYRSKLNTVKKLLSEANSQKR